MLFSILVIYLKCFFNFLFFPPFLKSFSLYETSPAPNTSVWSSVPMMSPPLASPSRAASQATTPPASSLCPPGAAGTPAGSQPSSPRYRPYTITHPSGSTSSPASRSSGTSILSSSPGLYTPASSPQAVPTSSSRQRPPGTGPPLLSASPGGSAPSRRPSSLRNSPRYLFTK